MNAAQKMLKSGFDSLIQTHGETFFCEGNTIQGVVRVHDDNALDFLNNTTPTAKAEIWVKTDAAALSVPFRVGMQLERGDTVYTILQVTPPADGVTWRLSTTIDHLEELA